MNLYYGSFAALAEREDWDAVTWAAELRTTLTHELTHHLENLGGLHALDDRDAAELEAMRPERTDRRHEPAGSCIYSFEYSFSKRRKAQISQAAPWVLRTFSS